MKTQDLELGYLAHPDDGTHPGVVMIHDVWGLADHTRDLARRLAGEGFAVLAIDLYRREPAVEISDPGSWMRTLSDLQVLADLQAGTDLLAGHAAVGGKPVGITGFCMGGMYGLLAAAGCRGLSAAAAYYGLLSYDHGLLEQSRDPAHKPRDVLEAAPGIRCPTVAFFGDEDEFVSVADVRALEAQFANSDQPTRVILYPGAGHAFMNDTRPGAYKPEIAQQAWTEMLAFFRKHLGT